MKKPELKAGDVYPAHVLRDEYGMNAENRPVISVDSEEVPQSLRHLIPYVERWGISCDVTRGDYFERQPEADIADFWHRVLPHVDEINQWLDEQPEDVGEWPEASIEYMRMLRAHAEAWQPTDEERKEIDRKRAAAKRAQELKSAISVGLEAFGAGDYATVVEVLAPFEGELNKIAAAKLKFARSRSNA